MTILFDIGGTNMRIARAAADGSSFGEPVIVPTPRDFTAGAEAFVRVAREISGGEPVTRVVGGIAGPVGPSRRTIVRAPNLADWEGWPFADLLERELAAPVTLENDAALGALGEARYGAGKGSAIMAYLTVGTGVGGARVVDGRIDRNAMGFEPGKQIIDLSGTRLEQVVSGMAVAKRYGMRPPEIADPAVWEDLARTFAIGVHNAVLLWSPDTVVLGGSMITGTPGIAADRVAARIRETLSVIFPSPPIVLPAALGNAGGLYGALALARE